jgi:RNA polymerase-binding transcription factor DksA
MSEPRASYVERAEIAMSDCVDDVDRAQAHQQLAIDDALASRYVPPADPQERCHITGQIICCDCRREIPAGRLEAQPLAVRCVECQQDEELRLRRASC